MGNMWCWGTMILKAIISLGTIKNAGKVNCDNFNLIPRWQRMVQLNCITLFRREGSTGSNGDKNFTQGCFHESFRGNVHSCGCGCPVGCLLDSLQLHLPRQKVSIISSLSSFPLSRHNYMSLTQSDSTISSCDKHNDAHRSYALSHIRLLRGTGWTVCAKGIFWIHVHRS